MGLLVSNNAYGTLNASITSSATTLVLASGQGARFPTLGAGDYFYGTLIDTSNNLEIVKVTARSTDTLTIVRAQDNTTARAYSTNDRFELRPTAALFNEVISTANAALPKAGGTMPSGARIIFQTAEGNTHYGIRAVRYGYSSSYNALQIGDGSNSNQNISLGVDVSAIAGGAFTGNGKDVVVPNGVMFSMPNSGNTDFTVPLRFDSGGRVVLPNQPSFQTIETSISTPSMTISIAKGSTHHNTGGHYNSTTGRFTAPVAGVYHFWLAVTPSSAAGSPAVWFRKNGNGGNRYGICLGYNAAYNACTAVADIYMSSGDYVEGCIEEWNGSTLTLWSQSMGGHLYG